MNIVYVLTCTVCQVQYVGETSQPLSARMNQHKKGIRQGETEEYRHFRIDQRHRDTGINDLFRIQIAEKVFDVDDVNQDSMKIRRLEREYAWICRLQSIFPFGLNSKVKEVGIVNSHRGSDLYNIFEIGRRYDKKLKSRKIQAQHVVRQRFGDDDMRIFVTTDLMNSSLNECLHLIRSKSKRFLRKCVQFEEYRSVDHHKKKIIQDRIKFEQMSVNPKLRKASTKDRLRFEINFVHKSIQKIDLRRILTHRAIKATIPNQCKYKKLPMFYYKYEKNISQTIFNYNRCTKETLFSTLEELNNIPCICQQPVNQAYVNRQYGHIITGDLSIVQNEHLRAVMGRGAKFRDCVDISIERLERSLMNNVRSFKTKWSDKERLDEGALNEWEHKVCLYIKRRISQLRRNREMSIRGSNIMSRDDVKQEIERLHYYFVITPVDKAANNFSIR